MNILLRFLLCTLFILLGLSSARAQDQTDIFIFGKDKGSVSSAVQEGVLYLDAQKTASKLGMRVELFATAKQVKLTAKHFYAILTVPLAKAIVNAQNVPLTAPVQVYKGKIMVPASFFTLQSVQDAVDLDIAFENNQMLVEKRFNLAYEDHALDGNIAQFTLQTKGHVAYKTDEVNKHLVRLNFPDAVVKRDAFIKVKNDLIRSVQISQEGTAARVEVVLGKKAAHWQAAAEGRGIVFRAAPTKDLLANANPLPPEAAPQMELPPPTVVEEEVFSPQEAEEMVFSADPKITSATALPAAVIKPAVSPSKEPVLLPASALVLSKAQKKMRIMLDPGHGGKDPGAVRRGYQEKKWNLLVASELYRLLKKADYEVRLTRDGDDFIPLSGRSKMANDFKADLFVSIHTNAAKNRNARGFQVYFRSEKATDDEAAEVASFENEALQYEDVHYNFVDALLQSLAKNEYINESSKLAGYVRNSVNYLKGIGIPVDRNNSVRQANFYVLKGVNAPAILIEMGYISNNADRSKLSSSSVQKKMAEGIYNGIYNYSKAEGWIK